VIPALSILIATAAGVSNSSTEEYVFVEDTDRTVIIIRAESVFEGKLDRRGEFLGRLTGKLTDATPLRGDIIARGARKAVPAYEYRSGRLVKGVIDVEGNFVPDLGGKVTDFKDYKYAPDAPRIWNLPGRFEKKNPDKQ
jgi:hypothetical protein